MRDLRVLARADESSLEAIDVREVIESTLAQRAIPDRVRIVRDYREAPPARANAARLGQVLLNLVVNAVESFGDDGAGEVRLRTRVDERGRVAIDVEDTGAGIAPETLGRVFDPF